MHLICIIWYVYMLIIIIPSLDEMMLQLLRVDNEGSKNHLSVVRAAPSILPEGWIVEEIPRKYMNFTDKVTSYP